MTTDWRNRGGQVNAGMQLAPLDLNKEHVFELVSVEIKEGVTTKFGIKNKVNLVWKETGKDKDYHRVWTNFNESYAEKSSLIAFLKKASIKPILPGTIVTLGDYLDIGMKIKTMLQARMDTTTGAPSGYYDFVPASIKPATESQYGGISAGIGAAMQYAKGCKNAGDAFAAMVGKVDTATMQEFVAADKAGKIVYPIQ
jgi:hypothetical protein